MSRAVLVGFVLMGAVACNAEKKADAAAATGAATAASPPSAAATAATPPSAPTPAAAAPGPYALPDSAELKRDAEYHLKQHKPQPAKGFAGLRVPGGCTVDKAMSGIKVGCYQTSRDLLIYMQNDLLTQDKWTLDKKERGVGEEVLLEASKGDKKIGLAVSSKKLGTADIAEMVILPR